MSSPSTVRVPEGMSCVNAFRALWEMSQPAAFFGNCPGFADVQAQSVSTAEKVAGLFKDRTYFDYEGGRMLKTDFSKFPELDIRLYERDFGPGSAKAALELYNAKEPNAKLDCGDSYKFEELTKK